MGLFKASHMMSLDSILILVGFSVITISSNFSSSAVIDVFRRHFKCAFLSREREGKLECESILLENQSLCPNDGNVPHPWVFRLSFSLFWVLGAVFMISRDFWSLPTSETKLSQQKRGQKFPSLIVNRKFDAYEMSSLGASSEHQENEKSKPTHPLALDVPRWSYFPRAAFPRLLLLLMTGTCVVISGLSALLLESRKCVAFHVSIGILSGVSAGFEPLLLAIVIRQLPNRYEGLAIGWYLSCYSSCTALIWSAKSTVYTANSSHHISSWILSSIFGQQVSDFGQISRSVSLAIVVVCCLSFASCAWLLVQKLESCYNQNILFHHLGRQASQAKTLDNAALPETIDPEQSYEDLSQAELTLSNSARFLQLSNFNFMGYTDLDTSNYVSEAAKNWSKGILFLFCSGFVLYFCTFGLMYGLAFDASALGEHGIKLNERHRIPYQNFNATKYLPLFQLDSSPLCFLRSANVSDFNHLADQDKQLCVFLSARNSYVSSSMLFRAIATPPLGLLVSKYRQHKFAMLAIASILYLVFGVGVQHGLLHWKSGDTLGFLFLESKLYGFLVMIAAAFNGVSSALISVAVWSIPLCLFSNGRFWLRPRLPAVASGKQNSSLLRFISADVLRFGDTAPFDHLVCSFAILKVAYQTGKHAILPFSSAWRHYTLSAADYFNVITVILVCISLVLSTAAVVNLLSIARILPHEFIQAKSFKGKRRRNTESSTRSIFTMQENSQQAHYGVKQQILSEDTIDDYFEPIPGQKIDRGIARFLPTRARISSLQSLTDSLLYDANCGPQSADSCAMTSFKHDLGGILRMRWHITQETGLSRPEDANWDRTTPRVMAQRPASQKYLIALPLTVLSTVFAVVVAFLITGVASLILCSDADILGEHAGLCFSLPVAMIPTIVVLLAVNPVGLSSAVKSVNALRPAALTRFLQDSYGVWVTTSIMLRLRFMVRRLMPSTRSVSSFLRQQRTFWLAEKHLDDIADRTVLKDDDYLNQSLMGMDRFNTDSTGFENYHDVKYADRYNHSHQALLKSLLSNLNRVYSAASYEKFVVIVCNDDVIKASQSCRSHNTNDILVLRVATSLLEPLIVDPSLGNGKESSQSPWVEMQMVHPEHREPIHSGECHPEMHRSVGYRFCYQVRKATSNVRTASNSVLGKGKEGEQSFSSSASDLQIAMKVQFLEQDNLSNVHDVTAEVSIELDSKHMNHVCAEGQCVIHESLHAIPHVPWPSVQQLQHGQGQWLWLTDLSNAGMQKLSPVLPVQLFGTVMGGRSMRISLQPPSWALSLWGLLMIIFLAYLYDPQKPLFGYLQDSRNSMIKCEQNFDVRQSCLFSQLPTSDVRVTACVVILFYSGLALSLVITGALTGIKLFFESYASRIIGIGKTIMFPSILNVAFDKEMSTQMSAFQSHSSYLNRHRHQFQHTSDSSLGFVDSSREFAADSLRHTILNIYLTCLHELSYFVPVDTLRLGRNRHWDFQPTYQSIMQVSEDVLQSSIASFWTELRQTNQSKGISQLKDVDSPGSLEECANMYTKELFAMILACKRVLIATGSPNSEGRIGDASFENLPSKAQESNNNSISGGNDCESLLVLPEFIGHQLLARRARMQAVMQKKFVHRILEWQRMLDSAMVQYKSPISLFYRFGILASSLVSVISLVAFAGNTEIPNYDDTDSNPSSQDWYTTPLELVVFLSVVMGSTFFHLLRPAAEVTTAIGRAISEIPLESPIRAAIDSIADRQQLGVRFPSNTVWGHFIHINNERIQTFLYSGLLAIVSFFAYPTKQWLQKFYDS